MSTKVIIENEDQAKEILKEIKNFYSQEKDRKFYFSVIIADEEYKAKKREQVKLRYQNDKDYHDRQLAREKKKQEKLKDDPEHIQYKRDNAKKNYQKKKLQKEENSEKI